MLHSLFVDFSSAFNTIQPHILASRLLEHFSLDFNLVGWIVDVLSGRTQRGRVDGALSSAGPPQGRVMSPLLFILYTNMGQSKYENKTKIKYADDSVAVIVSLVIVSLL